MKSQKNGVKVAPAGPPQQNNLELVNNNNNNNVRASYLAEGDDLEKLAPKEKQYPPTSQKRWWHSQPAWRGTKQRLNT